MNISLSVLDLGSGISEESKGITIIFANFVVLVLIVLQTATVTLLKRVSQTIIIIILVLF